MSLSTSRPISDSGSPEPGIDDRLERIDLQRDCTGPQVEAALGPPQAIFTSTSIGGDRSMWAYQRLGLYLYFNGELLATWRRYPNGCTHTALPRSKPRASGTIGLTTGPAAPALPRLPGPREWAPVPAGTSEAQ